LHNLDSAFRFYATDDDIRRAYRKIVLRHHPDKRKGQGEKEINPDEDYFTCITRAYEFLGVPAKRRSYDSIDPLFNDDLPTQSEIDKDFYGSLGPCIRENARWSEKKNVPLLGNDTSDRAHVERFYDFWYDFQSWREYSYLDEEDKDKGQDRDERRWIDKQNKQMRVKRKKEEMTRIRQLVDLAYNNDPRIGRFKKEEKERKLAAKQAKYSVAQALKAEEERVVKEAAAAKLKIEQEEQKRLLELQKEKEVQKRALKKERKALRDFAKSKDYFTTEVGNEKIRNIENVEKLCEAFKLLELQELNKKIAENLSGGEEVFFKAVAAMELEQDEERKKNLQPNAYVNSIGKSTTSPLVSVDRKSLWTNENIQLLIKAVNLFPAGTIQRWEVVANFINQHATNLPDNIKFLAKEVLNKAKDIQSSDFSKNELKVQVNQNAFESFEKNKKELKKEDNSEISTKDAGDIKKKKQMNGDAKPMTNGHAEPPKMNGVAKEPTPEPEPIAVIAAPVTWTKEEQAILEQAIKTYPVSTPDRWDRIAECIPNRTKKECLKRVKELVDLVNEKKKAQQIK
jgi:DnaJ homolog subfamily C member 2